MSDFDSFWNLYPRRVAKRDAEKAWARLSAEQQFAALSALPIHVRYWQAAGTSKEYLPYPASWINGERWSDELEMPAAPEEAQWWKSTSGIEAKARQLGITPRAGEDWHSLKARILALQKAA